MGLLGQSRVGLWPQLSPPSSLSPCSEPSPSLPTLIPLSSSKPTLPHRLHLGQEPHPPPRSWACHSGIWFFPSCRPIASHCSWVCTLTHPYSPRSLFLHALPSCLAFLPPLSSVCRALPLSTLCMALPAGEPPPRPPQPAIFTQSKWGCSRCLGPCPLSPVIPPLILEGTESW